MKNFVDVFKKMLKKNFFFSSFFYKILGRVVNSAILGIHVIYLKIKYLVQSNGLYHYLP